MNEFGGEQIEISQSELLRQIAQLPERLRRWVKYINASSYSEEFFNHLKQIYFTTDPKTKSGYLLELNNFLETVVTERILVFIDHNFSDSEKVYINTNPSKFKDLLEKVCLAEIDEESDKVVRLIDEIKGVIPFDEKPKEYAVSRLNFESVQNSAIVLLQSIGDMKPEKISLYPAYVEFLKDFAKLNQTDKGLLIDMLHRKSRSKTDQFKTGAGKLYRALIAVNRNYKTK